MTMTKTKMKMTEQEVYEYTKNFLEKAYNMELDIPIRINGRLSSTLGRFITQRTRSKTGITHTPIAIEISRNYLIHGKIEQIKSTIRHEAIHYALCVQGREYRDGQEDFENELIKHGSHSTGTVKVKRKRLRVVYACGCGNEWTYGRRLSNTYRCTSCKGVLKEKKREHVFA